MGPAREVSGGCAGNTAAGIAALGGRAGFVGQVAPDQLGEFYIHDLRSAGVEFTTPAAEVGEPTARSMILVTPDGHRTMNTFLGAAQHLPASALDEAQIRDAAAIYLEGYLWDPETPRYAMIRAIEVARSAGARSPFHCPTPFASSATATASTRSSTAARSTYCSPTSRRSRCSRACRTSTARSRPSGARSRPWSSPAASKARSRRAGNILRRCRRNRLANWSIRPARATCSRQDSSPATRGARASSSR